MHHNLNGAHMAGLVEPDGVTLAPSDEAQTGASGLGFGDQETADGRDSAATDAERKVIATLQARLAFKGFALTARGDGDFTVAKWGLERNLHGLAALHDFVRQIVGAS